MKHLISAGVLLMVASAGSAETERYSCVIESVAHLAVDVIEQKWVGWNFEIAYHKSARTAHIIDPLIRAEYGEPIPVKARHKNQNSLTFGWTLFDIPVRTRLANDGSFNFQAVIQERTGKFLLYVSSRTGTYASHGTGRCTRVK